jgi:2-dehydro-3-deoxyphosphooctonate aldolase (KDO 8-P synthase)
MIVIAGPCVIESESLCLEVAQSLKAQLSGLPIELVFKASFDKANRSAGSSFRGPGLKAGIDILARLRDTTGLQVLTDIHTPDQCEPVARAIDFLQIPAFLCRQTDLVVSAAEAAERHGRRLNIKKGQFMAPWDAKNIVDKVQSVAPSLGTDRLFLTERGVTHGYNALVVDMISFMELRKNRAGVIYDATHSIQQPGAGAGGTTTGGKREYLELLARAAFAAGAEHLFLECHPDPSVAKSDGPNAMPLEHVGAFVRQMLAMRNLTQSLPFLLEEAKGHQSPRT